MKSSLSSLKKDLLTFTTAMGLSDFVKITFLKSGQSTEKNELQLGFAVKLLKSLIFKLSVLQGNQEVVTNL